MLGQIDSARGAAWKDLRAEVHEWEKQQRQSGRERSCKLAAQRSRNELAAANSGAKSVVAEVPDADGKLLQAVVDALKSRFNGPVFLAGKRDGRVALIASVPKELDFEISGEQVDPGNCADSRGQRRGAAGKCARRRKRRLEARRGFETSSQFARVISCRRLGRYPHLSPLPEGRGGRRRAPTINVTRRAGEHS